MNYSAREVIQYVDKADVKMIRLAFCDVFGKQKNIVIMPRELERAFDYGIAIDASAIAGFGGSVRSDIILHPDPATLSLLPWRPDTGKVIRMFCDITYPDLTPLECDTRAILKKAVAAAMKKGCSFSFGPEMEFYLFKNDELGRPTREPYDRAGYMDIAPEDKGESVRREICLMMEDSGIMPECAHHEEGPGQNEIDFRYSDPVTAADNAVLFKAMVMSVASSNGLTADFGPKPLRDAPGSGMHINFSLRCEGEKDCMARAIAGIMNRAVELTAFLNPCEDSYLRLGSNKAPGYVSWSRQNRSQLIRIPAAHGEFTRAELRSPDPSANPYLAFALLIYAGLEGIERELELPESTDMNLYSAPAGALEGMTRLPATLQEARRAAAASDLVQRCLPREIIESYCG